MTPSLAPLGTRKLPATLDEFLLLLGPRRPPPRPIVQEAREEEEAVPRDTMERFSDKEWPRQWYLNRCHTVHDKQWRFSSIILCVSDVCDGFLYPFLAAKAAPISHNVR